MPWCYALGMNPSLHPASIPFTEAELRDMQGGFQERQPIPDDRAPVNDGLPHHEFVPSEFAPDSGRCDKCGGGPLAPIHLKPVDQMARIADALQRIATVAEAWRDYVPGKVDFRHAFYPMASTPLVCAACGQPPSNIYHLGVPK